MAFRLERPRDKQLGLIFDLCMEILTIAKFLLIKFRPIFGLAITNPTRNALTAAGVAWH
jgi:hypothetical protein